MDDCQMSGFAELRERTAMKSQPHLPYISDEFVMLFLHSNYYKVKETKDTIECYFTLRANTPDLFQNRDPLAPKNKAILDIANMVALPHQTPEGFHVLLYRLSEFDYSKLNFADAVRVFCMFNDVKLSQDRLSEGYIVIFDMKGCSLGHLTRVTLPALRAFMHYIQKIQDLLEERQRFYRTLLATELGQRSLLNLAYHAKQIRSPTINDNTNAHPCRLKKIHVVHTVSFINQVMCLVKPLIHSNLLNLLNFCSEGPASVVDKSLLPEDYGGPVASVKELHDQQRKVMEEVYRDWLIETEVFKVDEKKRIKKPSRGMFATLTSSFKSLDID